MLPPPFTGGDRRASAFLPFPQQHYSHPSTRTMEDVWNDITLSCLHDGRRPASSSARSIILQDFLSRPSTASPPATVLSLNSGSSSCTDIDALASSVLASFGKKRLSDDGGGGDRHHKRMIKNRESAARSRARKQAYITQLESEVERLVEENAKLREKQQKQMKQTQPAHQLPKKNHALQRTTTF